MNTTENTSGAAASKRTIAQILTDGKLEYLDYDFRARAVRRRGKPFDVGAAERNLLALKSVLDQHGITFWLVFGTCLGVVRDGGFIPHDTDTDVAVFQHDKDKVIGAIPDLIKAGLMPIRTKKPDDLLTFIREDEYIDIGFFGKFRDKDNFEYWCYQNNRVYGDHYDKFEKVNFLKQTFLVPQRTEAYLTSLYGAGWKTPVKNRPAKEPTSHLDFRPFSNLLALGDFFRDMPEYAVLKLSEHFPSYYTYSDIDILCANPTAVLAHIERVGQSYRDRGFTIKRDEHDGHLHLDFYAPGAKRLDFRFDLLSALEVYKKLSVTPDFAPAILAGRRTITQHGADVYVPDFAQDLAVRFLEFVEWKDERPEKVKHWEFVQKTGSFDFVEVVNQFTDLRIDLKREGTSTNLSWSRRPKAAPPPAGAPGGLPAADSRVDSFVKQAELDVAAERYAEAAEQYCAALEVEPDAMSVLLSLGACLIELRDIESARWCLTRVSVLDPSNAVAIQALQQLAAVHADTPMVSASSGS